MAAAGPSAGTVSRIPCSNSQRAEAPDWHSLRMERDWRSGVEAARPTRAAVDEADVICTATAATEPIIEGKWQGSPQYRRRGEDACGGVTFAELIAMNEADVALKPKNLTMEEAASIPLVGLTAWQVLIERAKLKKGQKVLIHAGSGGVGTFAIQLAKHIGATVATTTSTANVDLVRSLGADVVIDYRKEDFAKVLNGYDLALKQPGQGHARKVPQGAEARGETHFYLRPAGYSVRQRERVELVLPASHAPFELPDPEEGQAVRHQLLVCFHAGQWRAVKQDHVAHRIWRRPAGRGTDLPVPSHQRSDGLLGDGACKRQGRHQREMKQGLPGRRYQHPPLGLRRDFRPLAVQCCVLPTNSAAILMESSMSTPKQSQTGASIVSRDAPTTSVNVGGTKFVYRQLGPDTGVPVIFLNHLAAELDRWDSGVVDGIATRRRVIVFDNSWLCGSSSLAAAPPHTPPPGGPRAITPRW